MCKTLVRPTTQRIKRCFLFKIKVVMIEIKVTVEAGDSWRELITSVLNAVPVKGEVLTTEVEEKPELEEKPKVTRTRKKQAEPEPHPVNDAAPDPEPDPEPEQQVAPDHKQMKQEAPDHKQMKQEAPDHKQMKQEAPASPLDKLRSGEKLDINDCSNIAREILSTDSTGKKLEEMQKILDKYNVARIKLLPEKAVEECIELFKTML